MQGEGKIKKKRKWDHRKGKFIHKWYENVQEKCID